MPDEQNTGELNTGELKLENKKSLYDSVLNNAEKLDFQAASDIEGIDDEIALLRIKIKSLLAGGDENLKLAMEATEMLAKLVKIRYSITSKQKKGLKEAMSNVLKEVALPLGIKVIQKNL
jgi:hypothetical protein